MTEIEAIRARHAVRNYTAKPLSPEMMNYAKKLSSATGRDSCTSS